MEIKLLLTAECLEEQLLQCEARLKEAQEKYKADKVAVANDIVDTKIEYCEMLQSQGHDLEEKKVQEEQALYKKCQQLQKIKAGTRKLKQQQKARVEELGKVEETIQK